ncbi:Astacin-like metalloendopeptidase [Strongyloides ratti]|uniref:Metalloendopeptidase n=1 Tax=Strongyloides ratti TaxID=34506 RepID=A0A090LLC6_STRRB|nr:Astacin-like metalloendopeptidase [Strongyloides ratti]CEF70520.1 Astacin-like metalloendopeptidase [Strongyloides ratti]
MKNFATIISLISFPSLCSLKIDDRLNDGLTRDKRVVHYDNSLMEWFLDKDESVSTELNYTIINKNILAAMEIISNNSCVKFEKNRIFKNYILGIEITIVNDTYLMPKRELFKRSYFYLRESCTKDVTCIFTNLMIYLGRSRESNRFDRDNYISIYRNNIKDWPGNCERIFQKREIWEKTMDTDYDYGSYFHVEKLECSKNGKFTVAAKDLIYDKMIGQRYRPNFNDWRLFNDAVCRNFCKKGIVCEYDSYPNYNKCDDTCVCPNGFEGTNCTSLTPSSYGCGEQVIYANTISKVLFATSVKNCTFLIKSLKGKKIKLYIKGIYTMYEKICFEKMGLEIKYKADKGVTGKCFCGLYRDISLKSDNDEVLVQYTGKLPGHYFKLHYYESNS